ncbi:MAG: hypothetical protein ABEH66_00720 [Halobacteriales archaeon]
MPEPLAAFEDEIVESVAAERGIDPGALRELIRRQQRLVREFPDMTVEGLVHDWRTAVPDDPLIASGEVAYYLSVRETVWDDVVSRLNLADAERAALRAVNDRQFASTRGDPAENVAVVLTK